MAEIHLFPVPSPVDAAPETFRRLTAVLTNAARAGTDLGPRGHQIALLREGIGEGLRDVVEAMVPMLDALSDNDPARQALEEMIERFVLCIRAVLGAVDRLSAAA
ncbi:hypothetical protein DA075_01805 [Methylobacterium currus]|uniref:Uncharacterized protein n=1 Tax=Methylobacterium currus TaxID=2051553 RepID=A0A2R4WE86_9HYPH|nr:hypothetical protein [Methylobacterium currus]AWB19828.1 hypothetical protein DA075_01805 [Methylobacterium currus]UHC15453.1 hypothetical protein LRS73_23575 [Methylobacterium currus]